MQYKTIIIELLQQNPQMHEQLRQQRKLMTTMEIYAKELKGRHDELQEQLAQMRPHSDAKQIASEALEIAVKEMEDCLLTVLPTDDPEALFLDQAMAFIRNPSSRG